jgi:hypothetical protein
LEAPYEAPQFPEIHLRTVDEHPERLAEKVISFLVERGLLGSPPSCKGLTSKQLMLPTLVRDHLAVNRQASRGHQFHIAAKLGYGPQAGSDRVA